MVNKSIIRAKSVSPTLISSAIWWKKKERCRITEIQNRWHHRDQPLQRQPTALSDITYNESGLGDDFQ